jgi:hypothetical protein
MRTKEESDAVEEILGKLRFFVHHSPISEFAIFSKDGRPVAIAEQMACRRRASECPIAAKDSPFPGARSRQHRIRLSDLVYSVPDWRTFDVALSAGVAGFAIASRDGEKANAIRGDL